MDRIFDNTNSFHFTIVDNYILSSAGLNAMEQIVYVHLKKYSLHCNKCFPGIKKLTEDLDSSPNTVRKTLKSLQEKRFIDIQQRFNNSNEYTLLTFPGFVKETISHKNSDGEKGISSVFKYYRDNISPLYGSLEREKLLDWYTTFDGKEEIIIRALEIAVQQGVRKIKYIDSILLKWHEKGIKTLEQCSDFQKAWEEERRRSRNGNGSTGENQKRDFEKRYDFSKYGDKPM